MKRFLLILFPCLAAVPVCFIGAMVITVLLLMQQVPVYRSTAMIEFPAPGPNATTDSYEIQRMTDIRKLTTGQTLSRVREAVARPGSQIRQNLQRVEVSPLRGTSLAKLTVDSFDPVLSAEFVNAWADTALVVLDTDSSRSYSIAERGRPAAAPITPRKTKTIFIAGVVGVVLGAVIALALAVIINAILKRRSANNHLNRTGGTGRFKTVS